jgi:hypothetical protein
MSSYSDDIQEEETYMESRIMNEDDNDGSTISFTNESSSIGEAMIYVNEYVDEDRVSEIYDLECDFIDEPRSHGKYYIGYYWLDGTGFLLDTVVQPRTFFKYTYDEIISYLAEMSIFILPYRRKSKMQIMQLFLDESDGSYTVVLKTHWIRLIQRRWRNIYNERKRVLSYRKKLSTMRHSELTGKSRYFPGLRNMMCSLFEREKI